VDWYRRNRARSRQLFDLIVDEAYYSRPIALRHPIAFYEGHLPAFSFNTLLKKVSGAPSIDPRLESLFARGIDPADSHSSDRLAADEEGRWPSRQVIRAFGDEVDRQVIHALEHVGLDRMEHSRPDRIEAAFTILEHEAMHHETMLYMWQRLPIEQKRKPEGYRPRTTGEAPSHEWIAIPPGRATLGVHPSAIPFGWDNEFPAFTAHVPAFVIERHDVTNARFLEFIEAGGYQDRRWWTDQDWQWVQIGNVTHPLFWERRGPEWVWRGMFESFALPPSWPVYVSHAEASAFARWSGTRLSTEAEFQRAAYGSPNGERHHPWGSQAPSASHGVFDFSSWDPEPAGSHPAGRSAWGVDDLVGNGWEWTATPFSPFPGFRTMAFYPEYSADFFDGEHYVLKGASPATAREMLRPTFRNWFRARYPYVYATFRCVKHDSH
jgi:ergothioneine biosynthesis protein EgtB